MRTGFRCWLVLNLLALFSGCRRSQPAPDIPATYLDFDAAKIASHVIAWPPPLRLSAEEWSELTEPPCGGEESLPYLLHITAQGTIEGAVLQPYQSWCGDKKMPSAPPALVRKHLSEVESLLREARFTPWTINGRPAAVLVHMSVEIAPPEKYGPFRAFPEPVDQSSVLIAMRHGGCEGRCPVYSVTILGDGTVEYQGNAFVSTMGHRTAHISPKVVAELVRQFDEAKFFSALPHYLGAYDGGDVTLRLDVNGMSYTVDDESGVRAGLPYSIEALEMLVDQIAQTHRWGLR